MADRIPSRKVVELKAGGAHDPDGSRAAGVLGAYFEAEQARAFRRLLWKRLAIVAAAWVLVSALLQSGSALIAGLLVIVAAAGYALALEWRTRTRLNGLIENHGVASAVMRTARGSTARR